MVSVTALLALANWLELRKKAMQEEAACLTTKMERKQTGVKKRGKSATFVRSTVGEDNYKHSARSPAGVQSDVDSKFAKDSSRNRRGAK
jgi:hypothetical protein